MNAATATLNAARPLSSSEVAHWLLNNLQPDSVGGNRQAIAAVEGLLDGGDLRQAQQVEAAAVNLSVDHGDLAFSLGQILGMASRATKRLG
jgi:hypothetical protein